CYLSVHSFPTRRSSDLGAVRPLGGGDAGSFPLRGEGLPGADRPRQAEGSARTPLEGSGRTLCRRASTVSGGGKAVDGVVPVSPRSEEHTSELQSREKLV